MDREDLDVQPAAVDRAGRMSGAPALVLSEVRHSYGRKLALDGVSLTVEQGTFTALLGPNGAGKTTLFGLVTRLLGLRHGRIEICGIGVGQGARALAPLGVVFQQTTLDLDLTVRQNLTYFAALRGMSGRDARRRIEDELARLDMSERAGERVRELNGGHRRRVELARALLHEPSLLLLDEPTVGLDVESRRLIVAHVHDLSRERGIGVLWATHLIDEIRPDDALVVLSAGSVAALGTAEEVVRRTGEPDLTATFARLTRRDTRPAVSEARPARAA